jgi:hypothetical protein
MSRVWSRRVWGSSYLGCACYPGSSDVHKPATEPQLSTCLRIWPASAFGINSVTPFRSLLLEHHFTTATPLAFSAPPQAPRFPLVNAHPRTPTEAMSDVQEKAQMKLAESTAPLPQSTAAQQSDNVAHALSGAGGGLLSMALTYPLITLSTRAQVESKRAQSSTLDAARRIIKREGITGLYAGLESAMFGISVTNFVYYYCMR